MKGPSCPVCKTPIKPCGCTVKMYGPLHDNAHLSCPNGHDLERIPMTVAEYRRLMSIANDASSDGADPTTVLDVILHEMDIKIEDSAYQSILDRMGGKDPAFTFHTDQQRRLA